MKSAQGDRLISLAGGLPCPSTFPVEELRAAADRVLRKDGSLALQYTNTEGYAPLRAYVAEYFLKPRGIPADPDCVLLTSGSQQALDLLGKTLIDTYARVLLEAPSYLSAIQAFGLYEPTFLSVPATPGGVTPDALEKAFRQRPRMFYTVPTFQNPTGWTWSQENRTAAARLAQKHDVFLIEDDPYSELSYDEAPPPPLASFSDPAGTVITGTFSKILSPGIRMGWIAAPRHLMDPLVRAKQASDLCSNILTQRILFELLAEFDLLKHIERLRKHYRRKRDRMLEWLDKLMPTDCTWTRPRGGMFVWLTLPPGLSGTRLLRATQAYGVVFAPGRSFYAHGERDDTIRLNFTHSSDSDMADGLRVLAREIQRMPVDI
jgi:2-aminoadipate transaminase